LSNVKTIAEQATRIIDGPILATRGVREIIAEMLPQNLERRQPGAWECFRIAGYGAGPTLRQGRVELHLQVAGVLQLMAAVFDFHRRDDGNPRPGVLDPKPAHRRRNKKDLSERDICTKLITPALTAAGGPHMNSHAREQVYLTDGDSPPLSPQPCRRRV
jgi:hypothetical protein